MKGKLIEGYWDCSYCNTKKILGRYNVCPNCGKARSKDFVPYLTSDCKYVPDEKAKTINRNPDWLCSYCNQFNSDATNICTYCGATRTSDSSTYFEVRKKEEAKKSISKTEEIEETFPEEGNYVDSSISPENYETSFADSVESEDINNRNTDFVSSAINRLFQTSSVLLARFSIFLCIFLFFIGFLFLLTPKEKEITIETISWERNISIQKLTTFHEDDWYLPDDARLKYTQDEVSGTTAVFSHYELASNSVEKSELIGYESTIEDLGNGFFEEVDDFNKPIYHYYEDVEYYSSAVYEIEDVYETRYYYDIDRWVTKRNVTTSQYNKTPYWGEVSLASNERIGNKTENYWITGVDAKGKSHTISLPYDEWIEIEVGETLTFNVSFGYGHVKQEN